MLDTRSLGARCVLEMAMTSINALQLPNLPVGDAQSAPATTATTSSAETRAKSGMHASEIYERVTKPLRTTGEVIRAGVTKGAVLSAIVGVGATATAAALMGIGAATLMPLVYGAGAALATTASMILPDLGTDKRARTTATREATQMVADLFASMHDQSWSSVVKHVTGKGETTTTNNDFLRCEVDPISYSKLSAKERARLKDDMIASLPADVRPLAEHVTFDFDGTHEAAHLARGSMLGKIALGVGTAAAFTAIAGGMFAAIGGIAGTVVGGLFAYTVGIGGYTLGSILGSTAVAAAADTVAMAPLMPFIYGGAGLAGAYGVLNGAIHGFGAAFGAARSMDASFQTASCSLLAPAIDVALTQLPEGWRRAVGRVGICEDTKGLAAIYVASTDPANQKPGDEAELRELIANQLPAELRKLLNDTPFFFRNTYVERHTSTAEKLADLADRLP